MNHRRVTIRFEGPHEKPYRIYWTDTEQLATPQRFTAPEEAGPMARALMEEWNVDAEVEGPRDDKP